MWGTMLNALVRHCFVCESTAVFARISFFAQANSIATVTVVIAVHWTFLPATARTSPSVFTRTNAIDAAAMSIASGLAFSLAVRSNSVGRTNAACSHRRVSYNFKLTHSIARAVISARIGKRTTTSIHPLLTREPIVFIKALAFS